MFSLALKLIAWLQPVVKKFLYPRADGPPALHHRKSILRRRDDVQADRAVSYVVTGLLVFCIYSIARLYEVHREKVSAEAKLRDVQYEYIKLGAELTRRTASCRAKEPPATQPAPVPETEVTATTAVTQTVHHSQRPLSREQEDRELLDRLRRVKGSK